MYNIIKFETYENDDEYRYHILKVFGLAEFNEKQIKSEIDKIFILLKSHTSFNKLTPLLKQMAGIFFSEEIALGFVIMFSYDYFYLTHKFICDFLNDNIINEIYINEIEKMFKK